MSYNQDPFSDRAARGRVPPAGTLCAHPGCQREGVHPAPVDGSLSQYQHFCLEHVRAYNAAWRFTDKQGAAAAQEEFADRATWGRPTYRRGEAGPNRAWQFEFSDPLDLMGDFDPGAGRSGPLPSAPDPETAKALGILDLSWPLELEELKARFKVLVKRHHPDANREDPNAEATMKHLNAAYHTIREKLRAPLASAGD